MTKNRTATLSVASLLLAAGAVGAGGLPAVADSAPSGAKETRAAAGTSQSQEARAFCSGPGVGIYRDSGNRRYKGRFTSIDTESIRDKKARAYAEDIAKGDKVQVQRSIKPFKMKNHVQHPSTKYIKQKKGGYKSCSKTANWFDANVRDWMVTKTVKLQIGGNKSYAVRSCVFPVSGGKGCTKWFVDHK
ncbi:hypothetical protein [Streptomyces flavofungini]|uniref:Secreted protein n=1 Tax=Streptomyces flavofungini TaxID=68200 RepID=A0ABS0X7G3_9ACTN|nr:hypothetical protein [Streptomyces flavofungini]MBJ3809155.1 hypothetical protein [Streptomyces flavofungini]GHC68834.1 hypothetical protein GCM10010349_43330 [Streptomyces flavofungini]